MSLPLPKSAGSASLASPSLGRLLADLLLVALGAIPGSLLRWLVDDLSVVNLLGAFVLGWLSATAAGRPRAWLLVGGVGFCGSLTSFSGWILALHNRIQGSGLWVALACWLLELLSGLLFAALGLGLGQWMQRRWPAQLGDHLKHRKLCAPGSDRQCADAASASKPLRTHGSPIQVRPDQCR